MERRALFANVSRVRTFVAVLGLGVVSLTAPVQAAALSTSAFGIQDRSVGCGGGQGPFTGYTLAAAPSGPTTKLSAVLGGQTSALEAIRAQQVGLQPAAGPSVSFFADASLIPNRLVPGIDASAALPSPACGSLIASRPSLDMSPSIPAAMASSDPEAFLASKRIRIGHTNFDRDWKRVRGESLPRGLARRAVGALETDREGSLARVNQWVNHHIAYTEDRDLFGTADYWAGARRTLKLRKGDCEDIALLKMQLLIAAGIPRDDIILTIARDLVRRADHAVLIVRTAGGYRLLDNATDAVTDAAPGQDYRAILSFGARDTWLHGT